MKYDEHVFDSKRTMDEVELFENKKYWRVIYFWRKITGEDEKQDT